MPYFPAKNCWRSSSAWYDSQFLSRTYCMVPRWNWTKLRGLTLPLSDFLLVLCGMILPDCFRALNTCWKTTLKALSIELQFSQQFFMGRLTEPMTLELWYKFDNFLPYGFWEKRVLSLDLPPPLVASTLIMDPNARGIHYLECLMTFL